MESNDMRFRRPALQCLLGGSDLGVPWRWNLAHEPAGIYFEPMGGVLTRREMDAVTGYLIGEDRPQGPVLALPCTLNELLAFEDAAGVFRDRLEAGDETEELLQRIAADNPEAGELARALLKAPGGKETPAERRARLLRWCDEETAARGQRGAVARVFSREKRLRPTAHRPNVAADIRRARQERDELRKAGTARPAADPFGAMVADLSPALVAGKSGRRKA